MLQTEKIREALDWVISAASKPSKIILFGSYARGDTNEHSNLDVMVAEPIVADRAREMLRLQESIGWIGVDVDVLVYSEEEFEQRRNWCSTPVYWALREGKVVYEHRHEEAAMLHRIASQDRRTFLNLNAVAGIDLRIVCFHAQLALEKLLKAVLVCRGTVFFTYT